MTDFGNTHLGADDFRPLDWNRRGTPGPAGPPGAVTFPITASSGAYTYKISVTALTADPTDLAGDAQALQFSVYNGGLSNESSLYLSAAGQSWLFAQQDLLIQASRGDLGVQAAGVLSLLGGNDVHITAPLGKRILLDAPYTEVPTLMMFDKVTAPGNPFANQAFVFLRDNGAGKMQLAARFPSGAVQPIATEP